MKIGIMAPTPFFSDRGCHVRIYEQARVLTQMGQQVFICTYHLGKDVPGLDIYRSRNVPWYKKITAGPSLGKIYLDLLLARKSWQVIKNQKPELLHAFLHEGGLLGPWLKRWAKVPLVLDLQGSLTDEIKAHKFLGQNRLALKIFQLLENWAVRGADAVLTSSRVISDLLAKTELPPEKIFIISDGVDTNIFRPAADKAAVRKKLGLPLDKKIIVYLGLLTDYQGVDILLRAAAKLCQAEPSLFFLIMGYPDVDKYQKMALDLGLSSNVRFTGRVDYFKESPEYLAAGDLAVSAKISLSEANGKLLNYMAAGLPPVVFNTPVNREILGDDGTYAELGNERDFTDKIKQLLDNDEARRQLGQKLRRRAEEHFSLEAIGGKIMAVYQQVLSKKMSSKKITPFWRIFYSYRRRHLTPPYFPSRLWIEPTNHCNLACPVCLNKQLPVEQKGFMEMSTYRRIIDEAGGRARDIYLHHRGESLLHPELGEMIAYAKAKGLAVRLHTNATLLDEAHARILLDSGLDFISFSFDGYDRQTYEKIKAGAKYDQVLANIFNFLKMKKQLGREKPFTNLTVIEFETGGADARTKKINQKEFLTKFQEWTPDSIRTRRPHNWGGALESTGRPKVRTNGFMSCTFLWYSLTVLWEGTVLPCPQDFFGRLSLGNVNQTSLTELWNGPLAKILRQSMSGRPSELLEPCRHCDRLFRRQILGVPVEEIKNYLRDNIFGYKSPKRK